MWLRVHLVTIGAIVQALFGALAPPGRLRVAVWASLNAGLVVLLVGIPQVSPPLIVAGSALVMLATALLLVRVLPHLRPRELGPGALHVRLASCGSSRLSSRRCS